MNQEITITALVIQILPNAKDLNASIITLHSPIKNEDYGITATNDDVARWNVKVNDKVEIKLNSDGEFKSLVVLLGKRK